MTLEMTYFRAELVQLIVSRSDSELEAQRYGMMQNTSCWSYHVRRWTMNETMWKTVLKLPKSVFENRTAETEFSVFEFWGRFGLVFRKLISDISSDSAHPYCCGSNSPAENYYSQNAEWIDMCDTRTRETDGIGNDYNKYRLWSNINTFLPNWVQLETKSLHERFFTGLFTLLTFLLTRVWLLAPPNSFVNTSDNSGRLCLGFRIPIVCCISCNMTAFLCLWQKSFFL